MKNTMIRGLSFTLCVVLLLSYQCSVFADSYTTTISFTAGKAAYGPATYHKKNNTKTNWSVQYVSGWNATTSVYLYDRQYGDRATHIVSLTREAEETTGLVYLNSKCCQSSHTYKIVAKRDISEFSGAYDFIYNWTI